MLTEVLWSLIDPTISTLRKTHDNASQPATAGQSPAAAVITGTVRAVIANTGTQRFLDREGDLALRLQTTRASGFETRLTALIGELINEEASAGRLNAAVPQEDRPYVLVRIMESYIYPGLITGERPDAVTGDGWWRLAGQIDGEGGPRPGWERLPRTTAPDEPAGWQAQHASAGGIPRVGHEATRASGAEARLRRPESAYPTTRDACASRHVSLFRSDTSR